MKYWLGKKRSEETKRKISETKKGTSLTEEHKGKISLAIKGRKSPMLGRHHSEETKRKMSKAGEGKCRSKETIKKMSEAKKGKNHPLYGKHCSEETKRKMSKSHKGEKCHLWKGGITPKNLLIRMSLEFKLWRESVFTRDNYTCQKCGQSGGYLHSHHIFNFATYLDLRFAIDNGITLCKECHNKFHRKYGNKNNTKEQLKEFLRVS